MNVYYIFLILILKKIYSCRSYIPKTEVWIKMGYKVKIDRETKLNRTNKNYSYITSSNIMKIKTSATNRMISQSIEEKYGLRKNNRMNNLKNKIEIKKEIQYDAPPKLINNYNCKNVNPNKISKSFTTLIKNYKNNWTILNATPNDLQLKYCLLIGQEFHFKQVEKCSYIGMVNKKIYLFKETCDKILYQCLFDTNMELSSNPSCNDSEKKNDDIDIYEFFNLSFPLEDQIKEWTKKDKRIEEISNKIKGLRILKNDSVESFFSFLCSTNNNIPRITLMIDCLRRRYGEYIATVIFTNDDIIIFNEKNGEDKKNDVSKIKTDIKNEDVLDNCLGSLNIQKISKERSSENKMFYENIKTEVKEEGKNKIFHFYKFPSIETISNLKESDLRNLGFGYRSGYVIESAKMLKKLGGEEWIEDLKKEKKTKECIDKLIKFPGIGLKVANCICLFGLNRYDCIPIDTHIYDIIYKYYRDIIDDDIGKNKNNKKSNTPTKLAANNDSIKKTNKNSKHTKLSVKPQKKALTTSLYIKLFTKLKDIFGPNCGWAQTILFASELKKFTHLF
ncbi:N-glycosylase/DNA lyase, putative [Plasmodium berghei]|uniref:DNA-(apurinic or apyrimidinic site) lyase n=2 Tax=Plasmodium berghei TaxID=5821 RepID=A0A509AGY6_PLABA|nr:N-glycosylase/DNA lyase, putative [Plasmodium berghei ANKA]CXI32797.1 N-glycosylase/DNA lyase, putative [Plasmodium berghei]SCM21178.1 N-glycosylase/DNA lyase, putative [Plasmodium berghei]SCN24508.1 N-glycosylase/DNA lyase, putative [Plasmodium berghei]SCO59686.1 N-glycosylase/DNA lyase, putative [Plasmodium berghei]SCO60881.1 N-glycosylase/DNA lyase, putative [Plasmodium berghei]|eukprot:XP_034421153.1 N-glycosylase/DNA lyase, putative [Plasmodium berghei ANKA]